MPILDRIHLELSSKKIVSAIFHGRSSEETWEKKVNAAIERCAPLLKPRAVYNWYSVKQLDDRCVQVVVPGRSKPFKINLGHSSVLLKSACRILVGLGTIGQELDDMIEDTQMAGQQLESYLLDCVGICALMQVSRTVYRLAEDEAESKTWGCGTVLSPGAVKGWRLEEQSRLCGLLPLDRINVYLNSSGVLIPKKSVSFIVGIGPAYRSKKVKLACEVCTNGSDCWCKYYRDNDIECIE